MRWELIYVFFTSCLETSLGFAVKRCDASSFTHFLALELAASHTDSSTFMAGRKFYEYHGLTYVTLAF